MKKLRKYEFANEEAANAAILALGTTTDTEGNVITDHPHSIIHIGYLVVTDGTYDDEGNEVTAPVLSDKYSVDVIWNGEVNADWDANMIWCAPFGAMVAGGIDTRTEWIETCKSLHPELFPEPSEDELV